MVRYSLFKVGYIEDYLLAGTEMKRVSVIANFLTIAAWHRVVG